MKQINGITITVAYQIETNSFAPALIDVYKYDKLFFFCNIFI